MPTKKVAPKKKKPDKFVFEISDLKLIGQPVHKEFEGAPPAPPPHTATAHASGWHGAPGHGIFTGRVSNVDKASGYFTVSYEDGDDEVRLGVGRGQGSSGMMLPPAKNDLRRSVRTVGIQSGTADRGTVHDLAQILKGGHRTFLHLLHCLLRR